MCVRGAKLGCLHVGQTYSEFFTWTFTKSSMIYLSNSSSFKIETITVKVKMDGVEIGVYKYILSPPDL